MEQHIGVGDMVLLDPLTEEALLHNLEKRFAESEIYTYIGDVVVSVNPYKTLNIYSKDKMMEYRSKNVFECPPHVFSLADDAYCSMRDYNLDQCIIISGESGSGKTEASKIVMRYVAAVSGHGEKVDNVKEQLLQSNPVLEAFGNAKTTRNDNSSRFGKYMDLEFDFKGFPIGGVITNYLLEKSRVVHQTPGERNFHIFYYLLKGGSDNLLKSFGLERDFSFYNVVNQSGCDFVPTIDDARMFTMVDAAMKKIGFLTDEINGIYSLVAAIMHLGNVKFSDTFKNGMDTVNLADQKDAVLAAKLFGCSLEALSGILMTRTVHSASDKVTTTLSKSKAVYGRDALCKAIYNRLFNWIIKRTNDKIKAPQRSYGKKVIGVLDIYGFEVFEQNGFEQFIINYCNEKLQQLFIELTLKTEQDEYVREGIEWIHIDYFNNAIICELIDASKVGIIAHLDEQCLLPGNVTDLTFLEKMNSSCLNHAHYDSRVKSRSDTSVGFECFKLRHFAGDVTYNVQGFIDKNNDLLFKDMSQAMYKCNHLFLNEMFPEGNPDNKDKKRPPTVGTQMKSSVTALVKDLMSKRPHYIRCVKPNELKSSSHFNTKIVTHQVRYLGLLENIRVRRAGYCYRQLYKDVMTRYKMLCEETWPSYRTGTPKEGVQAVMKTLRVESPECEFGKTKLFIRDPRTVFFMERKRHERVIELVILLQKIVRGWVAKHKFQKMKASQIKIASHYRGFCERRKFLTIKFAAVSIQSLMRGHRDRKIYQKKLRKYAAPKIIKFIKQCLGVRFILVVKNNLPSNSPLDYNWTKSTVLFTSASEQLRVLHHRWRCRKYRKAMSAEKKQIFTEKLKVSELFNGNKASYNESVPVLFAGDNIGVANNPAWLKHQSKLAFDVNVNMAHNINKIHRANAKAVERIVVLSNQHLIFLHPKSLAVLYHIELANVKKISVSPFKDDVIIVHVNDIKGDKALQKGDLIITTPHLYELVAKLSLLYQSSTQKPLDVTIATNFKLNLKGKETDVVVSEASETNGSVNAVFRKKGNQIFVEG
ncbi:unconventional myosin-Ia-like [Hydractinia symbiolongicarpus]|uniref:unconventional myosin-Ia-like n=1 Tax=Hydractinia symbiolongicarpus TaxID=13093 RepID=UPI00254DDEE7|nr:unconventional myosin-Ia-like [Hydractinia symbiolongicarpus]